MIPGVDLGVIAENQAPDAEVEIEKEEVGDVHNDMNNNDNVEAEAEPGPNIIENDNAEEADADDMNRYAAMDQFHANMANDEILFGQDEEIDFEYDDVDEGGINNDAIPPPPIDPTAEMDERYGDRRHDYGLQPRRARNYGHLHIQQHMILITYCTKP